MEALLGSWPVFLESEWYNKILQQSKEIASWLGTQLWCNALCVILIEEKNAAVINLLYVAQRTGDLNDLSVTIA